VIKRKEIAEKEMSECKSVGRSKDLSEKKINPLLYERLYAEKTKNVKKQNAHYIYTNQNQSPNPERKSLKASNQETSTRLYDDAQQRREK
jgi:hypothetical protein